MIKYINVKIGILENYWKMEIFKKLNLEIGILDDYLRTVFWKIKLKNEIL